MPTSTPVCDSGAKGKTFTIHRDREPSRGTPQPEEVRREHREHEKPEVAVEPGRPRLPAGAARVAAGDACQLDADRRDGREHQHRDERTAAARGVAATVTDPVAGADQDQLLPQPVAMLARELGGHQIHRAEPLHRDEEGLLLAEPGQLELGHLFAQMPLELVDIRRIDRAIAGHRGAPLGDLLLENVHGQAPASFIVPGPQSDPSARVAVSHWRRCSRSWTNPESVIS